MHTQLPTWQLIKSSLQQKIAVMLLYVLESKGSSPGRQGFFMAVNASGEMSGSLGGGIMEHKFVELAMSKLNQPDDEISVHNQKHSKKAAKDQSGMICSGEQTIFLYTIQKKDADPVNRLIRSMEHYKNGTLQLSPKGISFSKNIPVADFELIVKATNNYTYREKTGYKNELYIIGAGHCSMPFSQLMYRMDFRIHLYDHRTALNTMQQNNFVHEKRWLRDYSALSELVPSGKNIYVVIMTFGYRTDVLALRALLGKNFKYIGMLGSKSKIKKLFKDLQKEGIEQDSLDRVYAPVGIPIKSRTTEEIAVSIAAEIIRVKNK